MPESFDKDQDARRANDALERQRRIGREDSAREERIVRFAQDALLKQACRREQAAMAEAGR